MCGILGVIDHSVADVSRARFEAALDRLSHRGPDGSGAKFEERFCFGHRRLSIIDLDPRSSQPMTSQDGRWELVFNGEIYNFQELRADLQARGVQFRTDGDSEVLLYSFALDGLACVERLQGMFAFAIFDRLAGEGWLVRDRLGIKPLYLQFDGSRVSFSSEIKGLLALSDRRPSLNLDAVSSYLSFRYPILDDTFFEGIETLPPGHALYWRDGDHTVHRYWDPSHRFDEQAEDRGEDYYLERTLELLTSSVRYRMISDVPFGAYLSGGVDSSAITALMSELSGKPVKTFTIGFDAEGYNEFPYARSVADRYGAEHREILLSGDDYVDAMTRLIQFKDAPLSVPNEVPLYLMSCELKKHITVVLSGEGADEIFGGYGRIFRSPDDLERMAELANSGASTQEQRSFLTRAQAKYGRTEFDSELDHFLRIYSYTPYELKSSLLNDQVDLPAMERRFADRFESIWAELDGHSYRNRMMYAFERVHLLGLLQRVDTTTMATSVEARVPFVDHRLVEFAFSVPEKYKLKWAAGDSAAKARYLLSDESSEVHDIPKYLLKKSFESRLPRDVLYRRKMGFPVPLSRWFGGAFNDYAREILLDSASATRDIIDRVSVAQLLDSDQLATDHSLAMKIWMLVNLELFARAYLA